MKLWKCSLCGKVGYWKPTWARYSSFIVDDEWPSHCVVTCSEKCQSEADVRHKEGGIKLPKFRRNGCGQFCMSHGPVGYKPQPEQRELLKIWKDEGKPMPDINFIGA